MDVIMAGVMKGKEIGSPANLYEGFAKKRLKRSNVLIIRHFLTIDVLNTAEAAMPPVHGDSFYYSEEDECLLLGIYGSHMGT